MRSWLRKTRERVARRLAPWLVPVDEVARWLRGVDRLSEVPGANDTFPDKHPLWDASFLMEREFGNRR